MALRRKSAPFSAHKDPFGGTQQQASHKEAEVCVAVVEGERERRRRERETFIDNQEVTGEVGIGVGGGSRRSGEEEAGGLGRRQPSPFTSGQLARASLLLTRTKLLDRMVSRRHRHA